MTLDPLKPVQTRDGRKARILSVDLKSGYPIVAAVTDPVMGTESVKTYRSDGSVHVTKCCTHPLDLINVPEKKVWWVNFYPQDHPAAHTTRKTADACAKDTRIACIRVEFEEGEGLE